MPVSDQFVAFLQSRLGSTVEVPRVATDVMRVTRFPGLESKSKDATPQFDASQVDLSGGVFDEPMPGNDPLEQGGDLRDLMDG